MASSTTQASGTQVQPTSIGSFTDDWTPPAGAPPADQDCERRASTAESRITQLESQLAKAESALAQTRTALDTAERARTIDRALIDSGATDLESTRLLTESAIAAMDKPDPQAAITDLKRRKPHLFRTLQPPARTSAMSATPRTTPDPLTHAAAEARTTGDRRALLRYLRLRRAA